MKSGELGRLERRLSKHAQRRYRERVQDVSFEHMRALLKAGALQVTPPARCNSRNAPNAAAFVVAGRAVFPMSVQQTPEGPVLLATTCLLMGGTRRTKEDRRAWRERRWEEGAW